MSIIIVTWIRTFMKVEPPLIVYAGFFPLWIVFFVLGVVFSFDRPNCNLGLLVLIAISVLILQIVEAFYLERIGGAGFGIKISSFLFSAIVIIICFDKKLENRINTSKWLVRGITRIGRKSFTIYLTHYLVITLLLNRLPHPQIWYMDWFVVLFIDTLFVIALSRITPIRFHRYLGI